MLLQMRVSAQQQLYLQTTPYRLSYTREPLSAPLVTAS